MRIKLRQAMRAYQKRTGVRLTYVALGDLTGLSPSTIASIAVRTGYDTRLSTVEKLCRALECSPGELLELSEQ